MVAEDLSEGCPATVGLRVLAAGSLAPPLEGRFFSRGAPDVADREAALRTALSDAGIRAHLELTVEGPFIDTEYEGRSRVRLVHRENIARTVDPIDQVSGVGVWIPESTASLTGAGAGDELRLTASTQPTRAVRVAGVYRELVTPLAPAWCAHAGLAFPAGFLEPPQAMMLADRSTFAELEGRFRSSLSNLVWNVAVPAADFTLPEATTMATRLTAVSERLRDQSTDVNRTVGALSANARLPDFVEIWQGTLDSVRSGVIPVVIGVLAVCLLFVASVARSWCEQRDAELALLVARGVSPAALGAKALLESAPAVVAGCAAGVVGGIAAVRLFGPSSTLDQPGLRWAAALAAAGAVVALGVTVGVVAAQVRRLEEPRARRRVRGAVVAELGVVVAAAVAWSRITASDERLLRQSIGAPKIDVLHILFPLLTIVAVAALSMRTLVRLLGRLRRTSTSAPLALFLGARRLAADRAALHVLGVAAAVAAGLFTCSAIVVDSVATTLDAKASRFVGADVAVRGPRAVPAAALPSSLRSRATSIGRWVNASDDEGNDVEVMGIDPATFRSVAFWNDSLSSQSISALLAAIQRDAGHDIPVLVSGDGALAPTSVRLGSGPADLELSVRVVGRVTAFPGHRGRDPLLIGDLARLRIRGDPDEGEVWARGERAEVIAALHDADVTVWGDTSTAEVFGIGTFRTTAWTFGFLRAVASLIGLLAIAGLLAHLAGRERRGRLGYAIARRFGLRPVVNTAAQLVQVGTVAAVSGVVGGAVGLLTARAVHGRLDALRRFAPAALLSLPFPIIAAAFGVGIVALIGGSVAVQRTADRADVVEVLRADG